MFVCHGLGKVCFKSHVSNRQENQISSSYVESSQSQTMCTACHPYKVSGIRGLMGQDKYLRSVCRRMRRRREEGSFVGDGSLHYSDYDDVSQLCSNAETHSVEVISVCGTLPTRPGMSKKNQRQVSNASKELGGEFYPCTTIQHQAAITVHLHTGPARLAWHLC